MVLGLPRWLMRAPPLLLLATGLSLITKWQDVKQIAQLSFVIVTGRGGEQAPCKLCDTIVLVMLKDLKINKLRGAVKCSQVCFGLGARCARPCEKIIDAMQNSTTYPCEAAGFCPKRDEEFGEVACRFAHKRARCEPVGACEFRGFPAKCELREGVRRWRRIKRFVHRDALQLSRAFHHRARYCTEPDADERTCIHEAAGLGRAAQLVGYILVFVFATFSTIVAIESPGGADDRHWLTFWVIATGFAFIERFADVLLSRVPRYYEAKLVALIWLIHFGGADACYRRARRVLGFTLLRRKRTAAGDAAGDARYLKECLPPALHPSAARHGLRPTLARLTSDESVAREFGQEALNALWRHWNDLDPRYVELRIVGAAALPAMDACGTTDAYVIAWLLPPPLALDRASAAEPSRSSPQLRAASRWGRLRRQFARASIVSYWRRAPSSPRAVAAALAAGRPALALRRFARLLKFIVRVRRTAWLGVSSYATFATAVHGGPRGDARQYGRRVSSVVPRTLTPVWNQTLELNLGGTARTSAGEYGYEQCEAPYSRLRIELWDRDRFQRDEFIGEVTVGPLAMLMDGRVHAFEEALTDPEARTRAPGGKVAGVLRFELSVET